MSGAKRGIAVFWVVCVASFFFANPLASVLQFLFWATLAIHVVEFAVFHRTLQRAPGGVGHHLLQTLLFGFFHIREARSLAAAGGESA